MIITLGVLSLFHIEIDLTIVASLMSVIGYSLNDSIVVSDRIRENFRKIRRGTPYEIMNVSLTQTLSRTLMTSGTTLMVVLMLYIFGGAMLQGFSLAMLIGVSIGTVSSIYVASALALKLGMKREHMLQQKWKKRAQISLRFCLNRRSIQRNEKERRWRSFLLRVSVRLYHRRLGGRNQTVQADIAQLFRCQATEAQFEVLAGFRQQRIGAGDRLRQRLGGQRPAGGFIQWAPFDHCVERRQRGLREDAHMQLRLRAVGFALDVAQRNAQLAEAALQTGGAPGCRQTPLSEC